MNYSDFPDEPRAIPASNTSNYSTALQRMNFLHRYRYRYSYSYSNSRFSPILNIAQCVLTRVVQYFRKLDTADRARRPGFNPWGPHVKFVINEVAREQISFRVPSAFPVMDEY
jgi:hypothetical protein